MNRSNPLPLAVFDPPCAFRGAAISALEAAGLAWTVAFASPTLASLWGAVGAGLGVTVRTPLGLPPGLKIMREADGLPSLPSVFLGLYSAGRRRFRRPHLPWRASSPGWSIKAFRRRFECLPPSSGIRPGAVKRQVGGKAQAIKLRSLFYD